MAAPVSFHPLSNSMTRRLTLDIESRKQGRANLHSSQQHENKTTPGHGATYKPKQVGEVVPPKIRLREDPRHNPEDHGKNRKPDKHRVNDHQAPVRRGFDPTREGGDVLGRCVRPSARIHTPTVQIRQEGILNDSLTVQFDMIQAVASLLNSTSPHRHAASVTAQVVLPNAVTKHVLCTTRQRSHHMNITPTRGWSNWIIIEHVPHNPGGPQCPPASRATRRRRHCSTGRGGGTGQKWRGGHRNRRRTTCQAVIRGGGDQPRPRPAAASKRRVVMPVSSER